MSTQKQPFERRLTKQWFLMSLDWALIAISLWLSFVLRLSEWWPKEHLIAIWWLFPVVPTMGIAVFYLKNVYAVVLRYANLQTATNLLTCIALLSAFLMLVGFYFSPSTVPRSIPTIFALLCLCFCGLVRFAYLFIYHGTWGGGKNRHNVVIYGAGHAGALLAAALEGSKEFKVVAFIDNDQAMHDFIIQGIRVHPSTSLPDLKQKFNLNRVLLAFPSASSSEKYQALKFVKACDLKAMTVPSSLEIISGEEKIDVLRPIELEYLLGRDIVLPRKELLDVSIRGKNVLVTGAGGSIGSELCRQILNHGPDQLVLYETSEFNLYQSENELSTLIKKEGLSTSLICVMGSVCDFPRLNRTVSMHDIHTVYHAAACKHVPLVEQNVFIGIENNIQGTLNASQAALQNNVERFILISSDKAVRPTNVMGATKRFAELIVQAKAGTPKVKTIFSMVRFGNVLGSSGSVIPLFKRQIAEGGPVTVTHRDVTRYFMTISEAALLVIQAGSMAKGGDVFVLDMGNEVKIIDMARHMIELSGLKVRNEESLDGDIEIQITGLRPGEKIHEELLIGDAVTETSHPRIMRAVEEKLTQKEINNYIAKFEKAKNSNSVEQAHKILSAAVKEYQFSGIIVDKLS